MDEWMINFYKSKGGFAKNTLETRRSTALEKRREYRNSVLTQLRQIPQTMSPLHLEEKIEVSQEKPKNSKRLEMLEKWKKEKEKKRLEAKKKSKPVFKVCRVKSHEDLNEVYSSIKGKKIIKDKAASSIQFDIEKKIPKPTSHVLTSNIANSHGGDKILQDKKLMRIDKKANAKSTEKYSTNKGNLKSSLVPHRTSQASSSGSGILKKTKPPSINNTGDLAKNKKLENGSVTKKLTKISNHKSSINVATNGEMNSQDKKKDSEVPKKKTPASKNHTSTSAEIGKLNISSSNKSQKSASHSQPSTSSFDNANPPGMEQTYTETQTEHIYTPAKSGKLNISTNNKSLKSATCSQPSTSCFNNSSIPHMKQKYTEKQTKRIDTPAKIGKLNISSSNKSKKSASDSQGSTSECNNASTPKERQTYIETQTVIEKSQSPFMSFAESILPISANQTIVTNDTICDNDYTLQIEHTNNSSEQVEKKSLRISLQKMNIRKKIESEKNSIQENGFERSVENLSETEKRMKGRTPTGRNSEYMTNCYVNLSPLNPHLCMMESTPLPNHFEKIKKTRQSIRTSRLSSKNQTETLDKEFNLSVENMESVQSNKSTKKTKSIDKKGNSVSHRQLDIPNDISIISMPNEGKFVNNKSSSDLRNSSKSSRKKRSPSETKRNSTRYSVSMNEFPSEGALNEGETPDASASVRLTRRRSRRVLDRMKKNSSTMEIESTFTKESRENRRSMSNKSRTSIFNTSTPAWNLRINDTYEENTRNNSVKKSKTKNRKSVPISHSNDETYFTPNNSASNKEGGNTAFETPKLTKDNEEVIPYISPFVTTSRGKTAARKEYNMRKSLEGFNSSIAGSTDPKSPKAAAAYFERILNREIVRIQELCEAWQSYKESGNVSDDAGGLIDMTIGQSNLLISKKFNQFRELIEKSRNNDEAEMKVQCEDLHGFWDMIFKQVQDLDKRFENLEDMKKNNWLEDVPRKKTPLKKVPKKKKGGRSKSTTEASSLLKKAIMAGRKKKAQSKSEGNLEIIIAKKNTTPDHKILANSFMLNFENNSSTPARGILKSVSARSEKRKTVAFVEATNGNQKENMKSPPFIRKDTPRPTRRSDRGSLGRSKLVFE